MRNTNLLDSTGKEIYEGDFVSLEGNITVGDGFRGGFVFTEEDTYKVFFDERISNWSLEIEEDFTKYSEVLFLNHAVSLLHSESVKLVN
jgi:hypothetical protein